MKTPVIFRIFKNGQLTEVKQFDSDQIIIGHNAEVNIDLSDETVSPIHCLIELRDSGYYICDLGSQAGTFKNGKQILDEPLSSGDTIVVGPFSLQFFVGVPKPKAPPVVATGAPSPPAQPVKAVVPEDTIPPLSAMKKVTVPPSPPPAAPKLPEQPTKGASAPKKSVSHKKGHKTFAPASDIQDLRDHLKPTKGTTLEVIVAWKERVLETYHFSAGKQRVIKAGPNSGLDVFVPSQFIGTVTPLINVAGGNAQVFVNANVEAETITSVQKFSLDDLVRAGKASRSGQGHSVRLDQGDLLCLSFSEGTLQIFIRYIPSAPIPIVASLLDLSGSELTGMIVSVVLVSLFSLYMSVYSPPEKEEEKPEEQVRLAQFVYNKPKETPTPEPVVKETPPPVVQATPKPTPAPTPKKIKVTEEKQEQKQAGKATSVAATKERPATKAADVRPMPSKLDRPKKFTSVKQGGAVKVGQTAGANANAPNDVTKTGLLSAFGGGGNRSKLDQAYTGSGELLGMADKATGTSGQNENRAGDDIGSKFKDSGAGGKGTATQGIANVGTKGRSSGNSAYGGVGFGGKGNVSIDAGGSDADFVGTIDREAVRRVIRSIISQIKSCYERQLRSDSSLEGKVVIRFEIEEQGRVRVASTQSTTLNNSQVESCVASRIREQRFPEPPQGTVAVVDYPFVFGSQR